MFEPYLTMVEKARHFVVSMILITFIYASMQYGKFNNIAGLGVNINSITRKSSLNFSISNLAETSEKSKKGKT